MSDDTLLLLKYFSSALGVGITFVGAWFFEYTKVDKTTGKRGLTSAGRWAVVLALVSLGFAGWVAVLTDHDASEKQVKQQRQKEKEQIETRESRANTFAQTQQIQLENSKNHRELLEFLQKNLVKLSPESREKVKDAIQGLNTIEDFKNKYPDLYAELLSAPNLGAAKVKFAAGYKEELRKLTGSCGSDVKLVEFVPDFQKGQIFQLSNGLGLTVIADPTGVRLQLNQPAKTIDLKDGYNFVFGDTASAKLSCGINKGDVFISCEDWVRGPELAAFELLQMKRLTGIKIGTMTYPVAPQNADTMMRTFACIKP